MVALVGLILTVLGSRLVAPCRAYALSLEGGSVGVMYLAVFGSLFYDLVPVPFGFTLLALLASTAAFLAVVQNAQSLAVLGFLGGFLAPFFATDGPGDPVLWLSYYLILNLGIAVIAWSKAWRPLNLLGFWFTLGLGASWGTFSYLPELGVSEFFLASFFLLYLSMGVLYAFRQPPKLKGLVGGTLVFGSPLAVLYAQRVLMAPFEFGLAWSAFGLAALYLALAWALGRFAPPTLRTLAEAFAMLGIGFATLTLPFAFETSLTGNGWALEGAALVWIGLRQRRLWLRASGVALQLDCRRDVFVGYVVNLTLAQAAFDALLLAASDLMVAYLMFRGREHLRAWERQISPAMLSVGVIWWGVAGSLEVKCFCRSVTPPTCCCCFLRLRHFFVSCSANVCGGLRWRFWRSPYSPSWGFLSITRLSRWAASVLSAGRWRWSLSAGFCSVYPNSGPV